MSNREKITRKQRDTLEAIGFRATAIEVGQALQITTAAARGRLRTLEERGWVESGLVPEASTLGGRDVREYEVTDLGEWALRKLYPFEKGEGLFQRLMSRKDRG